MAARGGHNRKTAAEHKRAGTYQPSRHDPDLHDAIDFSEGMPECPEKLTDGAKKEWFRVIPRLKEAGVLRPAYRTTIMRYCELAAMAEEDGQAFKLDLELRQYIGLLGLSPLSSSRIRPPKKRPAANPEGFDDL